MPTELDEDLREGGQRSFPGSRWERQWERQWSFPGSCWTPPPAPPLPPYLQPPPSPTCHPRLLLLSDPPSVFCPHLRPLVASSQPPPVPSLDSSSSPPFPYSFLKPSSSDLSSGLFFSPPPRFPASVLRCSRIHSHSLFSIVVSSPPSFDIWRWPPSCTSSVVGFSSPPSPLPSASTPFPFFLPMMSAAALAFLMSFPLAISAFARASKPSVASKLAALIPHLVVVALLYDEARHPRSLLFFFSLFCPTSTIAFSSPPSTTVRRLLSLLLLLRRPLSLPTTAAAMISASGVGECRIPPRSRL